VLVPRMHQIAAYSLEAARPALRPRHPLRRKCFELLGYDFMVDADFNVAFLEANSNPCLELSSPFLEDLLPKLIDNVLRVAVDGPKGFPAPKAGTEKARAAAGALLEREDRFVELELRTGEEAA